MVHFHRFVFIGYLVGWLGVEAEVGFVGFVYLSQISGYFEKGQLTTTYNQLLLLPFDRFSLHHHSKNHQHL